MLLQGALWRSRPSSNQLQAFVQSAPGLHPISSRLAQATTSPSAKHRGCFPFYLALSLSLSGQSITTGGFLECCNASHLPSPQPRVDLRQRLHFDVTAHLVCRSSSPPDGLPTGTRQKEESVIQYLWEILEEGIFLSPLPFVFLVSPASRFLAFSSQESHPSLPTHLTPQNLPFQGESAFFTQLQGQVLVPRFCISILSSLGWDSLRAHRRNGCTGTYSSGSGDPGRRSWIPLLLGTSPHTS